MHWKAPGLVQKPGPRTQEGECRRTSNGRAVVCILFRSRFLLHRPRDRVSHTDLLALLCAPRIHNHYCCPLQLGCFCRGINVGIWKGTNAPPWFHRLLFSMFSSSSAINLREGAQTIDTARYKVSTLYLVV